MEHTEKPQFSSTKIRLAWVQVYFSFPISAPNIDRWYTAIEWLLSARKVLVITNEAEIRNISIFPMKRDLSRPSKHSVYIIILHWYVYPND